jgi:hypothetical protein
MLTKTKVALATALVALTSSVAFARDAALPTRSAPAQMRTRDVALPTGNSNAQPSWFEIERGDRASSPYAGGGGGL